MKKASPAVTAYNAVENLFATLGSLGRDELDTVARMMDLQGCIMAHAPYWRAIRDALPTESAGPAAVPALLVTALAACIKPLRLAAEICAEDAEQFDPFADMAEAALVAATTGPERISVLLLIDMLKALIEAEAPLAEGDENCGGEDDNVFHEALTRVRAAIAAASPVTIGQLLAATQENR